VVVRDEDIFVVAAMAKTIPFITDPTVAEGSGCVAGSTILWRVGVLESSL
jgi:hypothetical protein